ncbi:serine/threonine protein kinase [Actinobacteria bacterium OK074]|nr:serine/threonine protein kinase [Actinobacteria bacterium OK074]
MAPTSYTRTGADREPPEYAGQYRLDACLGSGGMGVVHLATSTSGLRLAIKIVHTDFAKDPEFRGRFKQEIAAARRVSGAFTAPVVDADPEAERPWMATLFIPGPTLAEHVKRNGPMAPDRLRRLMAGLAEALRDIHRVGVVHRDLKPSNVLLAEDGPKVIDFGISRPYDSELRTETGKLIGTPPFMAPEQFRAPRDVGPAADIFALGSVLVHAATGRGPFDSDSPYIVAYQVVHDEPDLAGVPGNLAPLILRCLAKEPEDRPTADQLMRELRSVAASYDTQSFVSGERGAGNGGTGTSGTNWDTVDAADAEPGGGQQELAPGPASGPVPGSGSAPVAPAADVAASAAAAASVGPSAPGIPAPDPPSSAATPSPSPFPSRTRTRLRKRVVLATGAVVLVAGGAFVAVPLLSGNEATANGGPAAARSGDATATSAAGFRTWSVRAAATGSAAAGVTPQCSYSGGKLFCAQGPLVYALDAADGTVAWRYHLPAGTVSSSPPVMSGGLVHVESGLKGEQLALDPESGQVRWRLATAGGGQQYAGGELLLTSADGTVSGFDSASGKRTWRHRIPGLGTPYFTAFAGDPTAYTATVSDDGSGTLVTAVDPATGAVRWDARLAGSLTPVGSSGGALFLTVGDAVYGDAKAVVRYDPTTKSVRRVTLPLSLSQANAGVHGDVTYLLAEGGSLVAVDLEAGKQLWRLETSVARGSAPSSDGKYVYVSAADGRLLAVDARKGTLVGQTPARLGVHGDEVQPSLPTPVLVDGRVYASAPDGTVFGVRADDPAGW